MANGSDLGPTKEKAAPKAASDIRIAIAN